MKSLGVWGTESPDPEDLSKTALHPWGSSPPGAHWCLNKWPRNWLPSVQTNLICSECSLLGKAALPQRRKSELKSSFHQVHSLPAPGKSLQADHQKWKDWFYILGKELTVCLGSLKDITDGGCREKWQGATHSPGTEGLSPRHSSDPSDSRQLWIPEILWKESPDASGSRCCLKSSLPTQSNLYFCFFLHRKCLKLAPCFFIHAQKLTQNHEVAKGCELDRGSWWEMCQLSQFSSVAQSCLILCNPMDDSIPGLPVHPNSQTLLKLISIESVMPSNHLILSHPLLLLSSIFPSISVFSNESVLHIRCSKDWSFSFNISPSNEYSGLTSFRMDWLNILAVQGTLKSLFQHHSSSLWCSLSL